MKTKKYFLGKMKRSIDAYLHILFESVSFTEYKEEIYTLYWKSGKNHGETSKRFMGSNKIVQWNSSFNIPVKVKVSNKERNVEIKKIPLKLFKLSHTGDLKLRGSLDLDVSRFYNINEPCTEIFELESSEPLILRIKAIIDSKSDNPFSNHELPKMHHTKSNSQYSFFLKDFQETNSIKRNSNRVSPRRNSSEHSADSINTNSEDSRIDSTSDNSEHPIEELITPRKNSHSRSQKMSRRSLDNSIALNKLSPLSQTMSSPNLSLANHKRANSQSQLNIASSLRLLGSENSPSHLIPVSDFREEEEKIERDDPIFQLFQNVLRIKYLPRKGIIISSEVPLELPPAVFPTVCVLCESKMFNSNLVSQFKFKAYLEKFNLLYSRAPLEPDCSLQKRTITTLFIYLIIKENMQIFAFDPDRCDEFLKMMRQLLFSQASKYIKTQLPKFENEIGQKLISGDFDQNDITYKFFSFLNEMLNSFEYPKGIGMYFVQVFISLVDRLLVQNLLKNSTDITMSNAITWKSFCTNFAEVFGFQLTYFSEVSLVIQMASIIEQNPSAANDIAPHLKPKIIYFILRNFTSDSIFPEKVGFEKFIKEKNIRDTDMNYDTIIPLDVQRFSDVLVSLDLKSWNLEEIPQNLLEEFPFLENYIPKLQMDE